MNVVGYLRVSTDQQVESGLGLEAQRASCIEYAKKFNFEITCFYMDEGISGAASLEKRNGILNAIDVLKKGDVLLVAKRDRLGRDNLVLALIENEVNKKKARIISAAGEGTENDDPSSFLLRGIVDQFSIYERRMISVRTKAALKAKKEKGQRVGYIPFGYKLCNDGKHLEVNEEEKKTLGQLQKLRNDGHSIRQIANLMNQESLFNRKGAKWNNSSVHGILINQNK